MAAVDVLKKFPEGIGFAIVDVGFTNPIGVEVAAFVLKLNTVDAVVLFSNIETVVVFVLNPVFEVEVWIEAAPNIVDNVCVCYVWIPPKPKVG